MRASGKCARRNKWLCGRTTNRIIDMNSVRSLFTVLFALAFSLSLVHSEEEKKQAKKKRPAPVVSPTVNADGSVTFRIKANSIQKKRRLPKRFVGWSSWSME